MIPIRLIRIDDSLKRLLDGPPAEFEMTHHAGVGGQGATIKEVVAQTLDMLARAPRDPAFGGFLTVDEASGQVVGTCGYKHGPEKDGRVEIAYYTFKEFEGKGYATAMAAALLGRALAADGVREVIAHTLPSPGASTRVLEKIGLHRAGEVTDPEDGKVWLWEYRPD